MKVPRTPTLVLASTLCVFLATGCPRPTLRLVYDQGNYATTGWYSELNAVSEAGGGQQTGDDFVLTEGNASVTQVRWWGAYRDNVPVTDDFTFRLYDDAGGLVPLTDFSVENHVGAVNRSVSEGFVNFMGDTLNVYAYTCNIPVARFEPGRRYYLVILNDTGKWLWTLCDYTEAGNSLCIRRNSTTGPWGVYVTDVAFQFWSNSR